MYATVTHRDRVARHEGHYKIDCLSTAPDSVEVKSRRSIRHAQRQQTRSLAVSGYQEYLELRAEGLDSAGE